MIIYRGPDETRASCVICIRLVWNLFAINLFALGFPAGSRGCLRCGCLAISSSSRIAAPSENKLALVRENELNWNGMEINLAHSNDPPRRSAIVLGGPKVCVN